MTRIFAGGTGGGSSLFSGSFRLWVFGICLLLTAALTVGEQRVAAQEKKCFDAAGNEIRCPHASFDFDKTVPMDPSHVKDGGNGTVTDPDNRVMWKRCTEGEDDKACTGKPEDLEWRDAKQRCEDLDYGGFKDWRLPGVNELTVLAAFRGKNRERFSALFPNSVEGEYWTIMSLEKHPYGSFVVNFKNGEMRLASLQSSFAAARCIRSTGD